MDNPNFLQYFWDLGSYDEEVSVSSIQGIVNCLDLSVKSSNKKVKEKNTSKSVVCLPEVKNGREDLEYTISRLIKGLESQRECVRRGYSSCLSVILSRYSIPLSNILEGIEKHYLEGIKREMKGKSGSVGDIKDRTIGLLLGYLTIIKSGFFRTNQSRPYVERVIEDLWSIYNLKLYLQDMICEIIYLIVVDCCEYDPGIPINPISSNMNKLFDSRILISDKNEQKRNQLVTHIPLLNLFLKLRLFLENRENVSISGLDNSNDISKASLITIKINDKKWEYWNKIFFSPGYTFLKQRWEIFLSNIQYFIMFSPRIPNLFNTLIYYLLNSPCITDKMCLTLVLDIINNIQSKYFSNNYSHLKYYFGSRLILQLLTQLKYSLYSNSRSNITEKTLIKILNELISCDSGCFSWIMKTSLVERNPLSSFSTLFIQTFVGIITGKVFDSIKFNNGGEIKNYASIIFGVEDYGNIEYSNKDTSNAFSSLIPFLLNETTIRIFWERYLNCNNKASNIVPRFNDMINSLNKPLEISNEERIILFFNFLKIIILKTGSKIKTILKIISQVVSTNENLDSLVVSHGLNLIESIKEEMLNETCSDFGDDGESCNSDEYNSEDEGEIKPRKNNCWRKIYWIQSMLLEYIIISLSNRGNSILSFDFETVTKILDSAISFGSYNKEWAKDYRKLIYPRLEKVFGKITNDLICNLENNYDVVIDNCPLIERKINDYNKGTTMLIQKTLNMSKHMSEDTQSRNKDLKRMLSKLEFKMSKNKSELEFSLIINCMLLFYILEDCNCDLTSNLIINMINSSEDKFKLIIESIMELDDIGHYNNINDENSHSCVSGLNLLLQLSIRHLYPVVSLDSDSLLVFTQKISQLPDLWNMNTQINEENDELSDEDTTIDSPELLQERTDCKDEDIEKYEDYEVNEEKEEKDEVLYYSDNSLFSHLLEDDSQMPPKYAKQKAQKELEKQQLQRINSEMQNKLRMLDTLSLLSDLINSSSVKKTDLKIPLLRSIILLLETYRIACKHALYYSMKSRMTVFSDFVNKLYSTISKLMQINVLKETDSRCNQHNDLSDLYRLLIHIISKPIVEPQKINRWSRKINDKLIKLRMEKYSKSIETCSINITVLIISLIADVKSDIGMIISKELIQKWISQKRMGIVTFSYLNKLMYRIRNIGTEYAYSLLINNIISEFDVTIRFSKSSYQLKEYTNLINQTITACNNPKFNHKCGETNYIDNLIQTVIQMIDFCINKSETNIKEFEVFRNSTVMQSLELLNSLISLSKTLIIIGERNNKKCDIIQNKILESNEFLNSFNQTCNSGKMKRQINKLRNVINDNKKFKKSLD